MKLPSVSAPCPNNFAEHSPSRGQKGFAMQESSLQTRGRDFYGSLPLGTRGVFVMCVALYVTGVLLGFDDFAQISIGSLLGAEGRAGL